MVGILSLRCECHAHIHRFSAEASIGSLRSLKYFLQPSRCSSWPFPAECSNLNADGPASCLQQKIGLFVRDKFAFWKYRARAPSFFHVAFLYPLLPFRLLCTHASHLQRVDRILNGRFFWSGFRVRSERHI